MNQTIAQAIGWLVNVLVYALVLYGADKMIWPGRDEGRKRSAANR